MIQGISDWLLKKYKSKVSLDYDDEIFTYGIEVILTSLLNILILLIIGIISGTVDQSVVYFVSYAFLRKFIGGYHCDTNFKCITFNVCKYLFFVCVYSNIIISRMIMISVIIITLLLIIFKAPYEHKNRLISEKYKLVYKKYSFVIVSIYSVIIILSSAYSYILTYVLIVIDLSSIPCIIESYGKSSKSI